MSILGLERVRAVSFDVGGTLLEPWPSVGEVYADTLERVTRARVDPAKLTEGFVQAWNQRGAFDYTKDGWRQLVVATFRNAKAPEVDDELFDALYQRFESPNVWRMFPDAALALEMLSDLGVPLIIVSNWDERLRSLLEAMELVDGFASILISCEVGSQKPAPELFRAAVDSIGLAPEEVLHIGDSKTEDLEGARAAGLEARLLDRDAGPDGFDSETTISDLAEMVPFDRAPTIAMPRKFHSETE